LELKQKFVLKIIFEKFGWGKKQKKKGKEFGKRKKKKRHHFIP